LEVEREVVSITTSCGVDGQTAVHALNLGKSYTGFQNHFLDFGFGEVLSCIGADIGQSIPFVHAKLANADFHIQAEVIVLANVPFGQTVSEHLVVDILASFNLADQSAPRFGECA
jgi:hypothetical protein